ncbi:haloacid dehalogenase [Mycobacterium sp.]|uniref:haloacid dehalogenase n=1 Tax=Mycobacterium sp. TaxID=1785 RepID=UPI00127DD18E|nr:haloacid dehalogenase [Mycobacterium sp.]KAA8966139.1 MAG: haloacid dehalogenase [Mycobacterium sp.]
MRPPSQLREPRTFWWDRARPADADAHPLRAVIFDLDALAHVGDDGDMVPRTGLSDLVMSLFVAGIWVAVVSPRDRTRTETLVRQLVGEGLVETLVTVDDLAEPGRGVDQWVELYRLVVWELGITPDSALAFAWSAGGSRAAAAAGLPAVTARHDYTGAQASVSGCRQLHRRWWVRRTRGDVA